LTTYHLALPFFGALSTAISVFGAQHLSEYLFIEYFDPTYPYLFNGAVVIQGGVPGHYHHPGTSLQWLSGIISLVTHSVRNNGSEFRQDVVSNSELYMSMSGIFLLLIFSLSLFALGARTFKYLGVVPAIVLYIGVGGCFRMWYPQILLLSPESLVISSSLLITACLMPQIAYPESRLSTPCLVGVGTVFAVGITSKIIILPMLVFILILIPLRRLLIILSSATAAGVLIMAPHIGNVGPIWSWFLGVATASTRHSTKGDWQVFQNLSRAFKIVSGYMSPYYLTFVCVIAIVLLARLPIYRSARPDSSTISLGRSHLSVLLATLTTLLMGYKPSTPRDFVVLIVLVPCASAIMTRDLIDSRRVGNISRGLRWTFGLALTLLLFSTNQSVLRMYTTSQQLSQQKVSFLVSQQQFTTLESEAFVAYAYGVQSRGYAAMFGNSWAGGRFSSEVSSAFPKTMDFNIWSERISGRGPDTQQAIFDCAMLNGLLDSSRLFLVIDPRVAADYLRERSAEGFVFGSDYLTIVSEHLFSEQKLIQIEIGECLTKVTN